MQSLLVCYTGRKGGGGGITSSHPRPPPVSQVIKVDIYLGKCLATSSASGTSFIAAPASASLIFAELAWLCGPSREVAAGSFEL